MTRPRILLLTVDRRPRTGAGLRTEGLRRALERDFDVDELRLAELTGPRRSGPRPWPARLRFLSPVPAWARALDRGGRGRLRRALDDHLRESSPSMLIVSHATALAWLEPRWLGRTGLSVVLDAYDLMWVALGRRLDAATAGQPTLRRRLRRWLEVNLARRYELTRMAEADGVWVCSEVDRRLLADLGRRRGVRVVPNFVAAAPHRRQTYASRGDCLLFVGTLGYDANRDGVRWFLERVWPRVLARRPAARFLVAGAWPDWAEPGPEYRQPGVEVLGFVDDLQSLWRRADLFVCPLRVGSGTRLKILEAWSCAVPVVTTGVGIEGLEHRDGDDAAVADGAGAFSDRILGLLADEVARRRLGTGGFERWRSSYTPGHAGDAARRHCSEILAGNTAEEEPWQH